MLVEIKRLLIKNDGYRRDVSLQKMYLNSGNIISISDYHGAENFLLKENSNLSKENFSLIKLSEGNAVEEIIAFGTAEQLYTIIGQKTTGKRLLND